MQIEITDNSGLAVEELRTACVRALEKCGLVGEGYAKQLCPVDTGNLRNSITHQISEGEGGDVVYIGTNSEYSAYVIDTRNLELASIILAVDRLRGRIKTAKVDGI